MDFDELDDIEEATPNSLDLYLKSCDVGGGSMEYPDEYASLMTQASEAAGGDPEAPGAVKKMLELMSLAAIYHPSAKNLIEATDDQAYNAFLALVCRSAIVPGMTMGVEALALTGKKCTGRIFPNRALHQLVFGGLRYEKPMCAFCYLHSRASKEPELGEGVWAVACCRHGVVSVEAGLDGASDNLMTITTAILENDSAEVPSSLPLPWKRLCEHLAQVKRMGEASELGEEQWDRIRELYHPSPPIKMKTYQSSAGGAGAAPRLVLIMHGAMNTMKQNDFVHACIFKMGALSADNATVVGVEFDYRHHGWGDLNGYSCERPEQIISRQGEIVLQAVRVYRQCIEAHVGSNPRCKTVDIIAFSSGAYLAYILLCLASTKAEPFRIGTLTLLSARLEDPAMVADKLFLKHQLKVHDTRVFLGWGELEDSEELGSPFTSISQTLKKSLPPSHIVLKSYAEQGHTMTPAELVDVRNFLEAAWQV